MAVHTRGSPPVQAPDRHDEPMVHAETMHVVPSAAGVNVKFPVLGLHVGDVWHCGGAGWMAGTVPSKQVPLPAQWSPSRHRLPASHEEKDDLYVVVT
jgi:hypothetical protein